MDFDWIAIAAGDVVWISVAFLLGLVSRLFGLPPLVGFLGAGFILNLYGYNSGEMLEKLSDLGITLLLFTVGLKLRLHTLSRPHVWAVTGLHIIGVVTVFTFLLYGLALSGVSVFADLTLETALLIAFALSFSSTVFVVKVLEDKGQVSTLHGRLAIGILIMQDIAAVVFLAVSIGKLPSPWAILVVLLFPLRPILVRLLERVGHGELLVLYGFLLAMGGAEIFELVGLKGDLGALVFGVLIASHKKADELAKTMLGFKNLFLLGFFLSIGLAGQISYDTVIAGAWLVPLILLKSVLFYGLFVGFRLRARTALLATFNLANYSEFGLIVVAVGVANGWITGDWLLILAIALSLSYVLASVLDAYADQIYSKHRAFWSRWQRRGRLDEDLPINVDGARIAIIGMGGIGTGAYSNMQSIHGETVIGIDVDPRTVNNHKSEGRNVLLGDPSDADFWDRIQAAHTLELVMLALPKQTANLAVLEQLQQVSYGGRIAAIAKFPDEGAALSAAGADIVFDVYTEAGAGFASHVAGTAWQ